LPEVLLTLTDAPPPEAESAIADGLNAFNERQTGIAHSRPLAVLLHGANTGALLGGLVGRTSLGLFFVDLIFVPDELRGSGVGSEIMSRAEAEAVARGCTQAVLYTIAFQAPGFYQRLGYQVFGEVRSGPADQARIFMTKSL